MIPYVDIIIGVSRPKGGGLSSRNWAFLKWRTPAGRTYVTWPTQYPA